MAWWERDERGPASRNGAHRREVPRGVWTKCRKCGEMQVEEDLNALLAVCPRCGHHHPLSALERLELLLDPGSFEALGQQIMPADPLGFRDSKDYKDRLAVAQKKTGYNDAILVGRGRIEGAPVCMGAMAFEFLGGSMGSVVGELITLMLEEALKLRCPAIISSASGGARMQEGILSLMQMAKTAAALRRLKEAGVPYISILHHPTTGGVAASFSMLGDVIIAEPDALIGFAGPRVIEQTIGQTLPPGFQRSEFLLDRGMIDMIVPRRHLRQRVAFLLRVLQPARQGERSGHGAIPSP